jgi:PAS domain S-box-containing protein
MQVEMNAIRTNQADSRGRILIVEDQGVVATDIERCLEDGGFEVTGIATSMKDAVREVTTVRPDLILMDIRIKGEADGIAAADYLHRHFGVPIVYLTAHDDHDTMERAKQTEPMAFLVKPFKPAELTSTVEIALKRSRAEEQVRERERSFLSAMDAIGDGVFTTDARGLIRFINRAAQTLTGWTQDLALGRHASEIVRVVDGQTSSIARFRDLLDVHNLTEPEHEYQILSLTNADHRWLTLKAMSIPGANDALIRIVVMRDITKRKQFEQALRRQADLLDQSHEAILTWDLDGTIRFWNQGANKLYGYTSRETLGMTLDPLLRGAGQAVGKPWEPALKREGRWSGELTRKTKEGREILVEVLLVVVQDGAEQKTVLETDRDITERKSTEREILRLNRELRARVNELTSLNRELESFNYSISHDLRAPLRHINGFARLLLDSHNLTLPQEDREHLESVRVAAQKMGRMVDALLELSRTARQEPKRQPTEIKALVDDVLAELNPDARERHVEWRIGDLPKIDCDPTLTRQVLANLLGNAVKFTRGRNPAVIEAGHAVKDGQVSIFVKDNGIGFDMKYADQLFGVFQRMHSREDFEGTGIGLAIVQRIIHKHGGRIWAEAEAGKGATFYFTLAPAVLAPPSAEFPALLLEGSNG